MPRKEHIYVERLAESMRQAGYKRGAPSIWQAMMDDDYVQSLKCESCSNQLTYVPFVLDSKYQYGYRAFALCKKCGTVKEI
jgi:hypothetical protein